MSNVADLAGSFGTRGVGVPERSANRHRQNGQQCSRQSCNVKPSKVLGASIHLSINFCLGVRAAVMLPPILKSQKEICIGI